MLYTFTSIDYSSLPFEPCREIPNAETIAAMREAQDIASGKIQSKSYASFREMLDETLAEDEDTGSVPS